MPNYFFRIILILLLPLNLFAQDNYTLNWDEGEVEMLDTNWFYLVTPSITIPSDSLKWNPVSDETIKLGNSDSVVWYRTQFSVNDSLRSNAVTVKMFRGGDNTIYVNHKHVHQMQQNYSVLMNHLVPAAFTPSADSLQTLHIRSTFHELGQNRKVESQPRIAVIPYQKEIRNVLKILTICTAFLTFLMATFLILGFFHAVLFLFYKEEKSNLFLGLFCVVFGTFFLISLGLLVSNTKSLFFTLFDPTVFLLPFLPIFLLGLFDTVFYGRLRSIFWIFLAALILFRFLEHHDILNIGMSFMIALAAFIEKTRIIIVSVRKKKPGSRIIGLGLLFTIVAVPVVIWSAIHFVSNGLTSEVWVFIAVLAAVAIILLSIPLTMSFHFASQFSKTNRALKHQIEQVRELSDMTIRQEQEKKKILEDQKHILEIQVEERTKEVVFQKKLLEEKNKDITDSINYARRIQYAILHKEEEFKALFNDSFILFIPKDIVSGDFYWFQKKNGFTYVAGADCTGHGVPGAFMSMIGNTILNDIINDNKEVQPASVLYQLNNRVREILKQDSDNGETRDGMDITFSKFDPSSRKLELSSGMRPVYIIRNGGLIEVKPDKFSIGGFQEKEKNFTNNILQLEKNDVVYFFSDGYADQFGGERGKKFMIKNFQRFLLQIWNEPLAQQKEKLNQLHLDWKGKHEQIDDILVIGFRVE